MTRGEREFYSLLTSISGVFRVFLVQILVDGGGFIEK